MEFRQLPPTSGDELPGLKPPQFRLRTLLGAIALLAVLLAAARWTAPVVWGVVLFAAASILAHVAGNALGTQLRRRNGSRFRGGEDAAPQLAVRRPPPSPPSHLHLRKSLGRPIQIVTVLGGIAGAIGGCCWIWSRYGAQADGAAFVIASAGFGGLAAFLTFLTCSFLQVISQAIHQADTGGNSPKN